MKQRTYQEGLLDGYKEGTKSADKWIFMFSVIAFITGFIGGMAL